MYYSLIPSGKGAAAVFSWIPKWGEACLRFMKTLCSLHRSLVPDTIIRLLNKSFIHRPADKDGASRDEWGEEKRVSGKEG
jgi:hypothetical protein